MLKNLKINRIIFLALVCVLFILTNINFASPGMFCGPSTTPEGIWYDGDCCSYSSGCAEDCDEDGCPYPCTDVVPWGTCICPVDGIACCDICVEYEGWGCHNFPCCNPTDICTGNRHCCKSGEDYNTATFKCEVPAAPDVCENNGDSGTGDTYCANKDSSKPYCCGSAGSGHCEACCRPEATHKHCGLCEKCDNSGGQGNWACIDQGPNQDLKSECSQGSWTCVGTSGDNACVRQRDSGDCDGNGKCAVNDDTQNIAAGYTCVNGQGELYPDVADQCDPILRCSDCMGDNCYGASYTAPADYKCRGFCDGNGHCDYAGNAAAWPNNRCGDPCGNAVADCGETCDDGGGGCCSADCTSALGTGTLCNSAWACTSNDLANGAYNNGGYGYETQGYCNGAGTCNRAGSAREPDNAQSACECEVTGSQAACSGGESNCWGNNDCCGDDGAADDYMGASSTWTCCVDGVWQANPDLYRACCEAYDPDTDECQGADTNCWDVSAARCCGDDTTSDDWCAGAYTACVDGTFRTNADAYTYVCTCGGGSWATGGESSGFGGYTTGTETQCCGDDGSENYRTQKGHGDNNAQYGNIAWVTGTTRCCDNTDNIDYNDNCITSVNTVGTGRAIDTGYTGADQYSVPYYNGGASHGWLECDYYAGQEKQ
ncbi:hypothetical protein AYK26_06420 [Euryarchaeota archaeon SM23-78]|nr:MAG: hypothetical protein AYK26_06420 [Euryarchaeota archaeon SM23-78]